MTISFKKKNKKELVILEKNNLKLTGYGNTRQYALVDIIEQLLALTTMNFNDILIKNVKDFDKVKKEYFGGKEELSEIEMEGFNKLKATLSRGMLEVEMNKNIK